MSILSKRAVIALGASCLALSVAPEVQAGSFYNGWNYTVDANNDAYGGNPYEIGGIAFQETEDSIVFAITSNTPLGGHRGDRIAWGDLFLNFTGQDFQTASDSNSLFAVRFDEKNESGASTLGLYSDASSKSVSRQNGGYSTLDQYGYRIDRQVVGQEEYTDHDWVVTGQREVPSAGWVWVPGHWETFTNRRGRQRERWVRGQYEWQETTRMEDVYEWQEVTRTRNVYEDVRVNSNYGRSENAMGDLENTSEDVYEYLFGDRSESEADQIGLQNVIDEGTRIGDVEIVDAGVLAASGLDFSHVNAQGNNTFGFRLDKSLLPDAAFIASVFLECANDGIAICGQKKKVPEPTSVLGLVLVGGMLAGSHRLRRKGNVQPT